MQQLLGNLLLAVLHLHRVPDVSPRQRRVGEGQGLHKKPQHDAHTSTGRTQNSACTPRDAASVGRVVGVPTPHPATCLPTSHCQPRRSHRQRAGQRSQAPANGRQRAGGGARQRHTHLVGAGGATDGHLHGGLVVVVAKAQGGQPHRAERLVEAEVLERDLQGVGRARGACACTPRHVTLAPPFTNRSSELRRALRKSNGGGGGGAGGHKDRHRLTGGGTTPHVPLT
jgi:hypothetical protein